MPHRALACRGTVGLEAAATLSAQDGASATERLNRLLPLGSLGSVQPLCAAAAPRYWHITRRFTSCSPTAPAPSPVSWSTFESPARAPRRAQTRLEALTPQGLFSSGRG